MRDDDAALLMTTKPVVAKAPDHRHHLQSVAADAASACRAAPAIGQAKTVTSPILVRVANWLRCRKLPNASPSTVVLMNGAKDVLHPKYCSSPITPLTAAASHHDNIVACGSPGRSHAAINNSRAPQVSDTNQGKVAGQGPIAAGHNQGRVNAATTSTVRTQIRIQSGQGIAAIKGSNLPWFSHANLTARHCCSETMPHIWRNAKAASAGRWFNASAAASF